MRQITLSSALLVAVVVYARRNIYARRSVFILLLHTQRAASEVGRGEESEKKKYEKHIRERALGYKTLITQSAAEQSGT